MKLVEPKMAFKTHSKEKKFRDELSEKLYLKSVYFLCVFATQTPGGDKISARQPSDRAVIRPGGVMKEVRFASKSLKGGVRLWVEFLSR